MCKHRTVKIVFYFMLCALLSFPFGMRAQTPDTSAEPNGSRPFSSVFGKNALVFPLGNQKLQIEYTDSAFPGDAVFVRCTLRTLSLEKASVQLMSASGDKVLLSASLYEVRTGSCETERTAEKIYIAMLPLSTWYEPGTFRAVLSYRVAGKDEAQLTLPVTVQAKKFPSETIALDGRNTAIKTDTSTARKTQIERLNAILEKTDYGAVYHSGTFAPPVKQTRRTSFFAERRVFTYTNGKSSTGIHHGIDFGIPTGTPVFACGRGKVVLAENRVSTGYSVVIEHLPGFYSLYYHLSSYSVQEGDMVELGDPIGLSGATGLATGPHLHWELRLLGRSVNPDLFTETFPIDK